MRIVKALGFVLILSLTAIGQTTSSVRPDSKDDIAERRLCDDEKSDCSTFYDVFADDEISDVMYLTTSFADLPGGFATLPEEDFEAKRSFSPRSLKLKDVLDGVVSIEPRYQWEVADGVINLLPKAKYPLFDVRIADFHVENANVKQMLEALQETKDFQKGLTSLNMSKPHPIPSSEHGFGFIGLVGKPLEPKNKFTVSMKNATVLEILNEIVRKDGCAVWSYKEWLPSAGVSPNGGRWYELGLLDYCPETPAVKPLTEADRR